MATKDWKVWFDREDYKSWTKTKTSKVNTKKVVAVFSEDEYPNKKPYKWSVQIAPQIKPVRTFRTESQATAFAMQYMRSH